MALFYLICSLVELTCKIRSKKIWLAVLILPLFILVAFRSINIGNDTLNYYICYNNIANSKSFREITSRYEIGYLLLNYLFSLIGFNYYEFQIIVSLFIYIVFYKFIYKYSSNCSLSLFTIVTLRYMDQTMNIMRAYIALSILLLSVKYIIDRKFVKFLVLNIIATTIHFSSVFFIILYFIVNIKWDKLKIFLATILSFTVFFLFGKIVEIIVKLTGRYTDYLNNNFFNVQNNIAVFMQLFIALAFYIAAFDVKFIEIKREQLVPNLKKNITIRDICNSALFIYVVTSFWGLNTVLMSRVNMYYSIFLIIIVPDLIKLYKKKKYGIFINFFIILGMFLSYYIVLKYRPQWNYVYPYEFFF